MSVRSFLSRNAILHYLFNRWKGATVSLHNTLYFNLAAFPFRVAIKFPVWIYQGVKLEQVGKININYPVQSGIVRIGKRMFYRGKKTVFINRGCITFNGYCEIMGGALVHTLRNCSHIHFGHNVMIAEEVNILCDTELHIGDYTRITFGVLIIDSEFHHVINISSGDISPIRKPIYIGRYNWIGNRTTIKKGAKTPDYCIVSNGSMITKDFSDQPLYTLLMGIPAKVKGVGFRRVYNDENDIWLQQQFATENIAKVNIPKDNADPEYNKFCSDKINVHIH